jgi:3-oxoacyl-[acyl-carrier protein] reductase
LVNSQKVVLVSGSTNGIGKAVASRFVSDGYTVIQNSRNKIDEKNILGVKYIEGDVTNYETCLNIIERIKIEYGRLDVLVCNVGNGASLDPDKSTEERWSHFLTSNLLSTTFLVDAAISMLMKSKGNVVAVSSICGSTLIKSAPIEYSAAKAALNMYIRLMALIYGEKRVRFNAVSPGNVMFEGSTWHSKIKKNKEDVNKFISKNVPMGTFIQPEAVAEAILFLADNRSKFTTGVILNIDGGQGL